MASAISWLFFEKIMNCTDSRRTFITWSSMKFSTTIVHRPNITLWTLLMVSPNCGKNMQLPMMHKSMASNTCPSEKL